MSTQQTKPATGHVALIERKRAKHWYARIRIGGSGGQQIVRKLGPAWTERGRPRAGYFTKKTAQAALRQMLADADRGTLAAAARGSGIPFADAAAEWLRYLRDDREREPSTIGDYEGVVRGYLLPRFGDRDVGSITSREIETYRDELKALTRTDGSRRLSNRVIVRHLVVLHGIYRRAMKVWPDAVLRNPAGRDEVERPPVRYDSADFRTLTPDEVRLVASKMERPVEGALVLTAAFTGLRLGELLALRWEDVDFGLSMIRVRRSLANGTRVEKTTKSGKVRSTPLVDEVAVALDRLSRRPYFAEPSDRVFCDEVGGYLSDGMLRRRFYEALDRAELPRVRIHDLRHAFGTLAVQAFDAISDVQGYLGHAHVSTTMRYVHHQSRAGDAARLQAVLAGNGVSNEISNPAILRASIATEST